MFRYLLTLCCVMSLGLSASAQQVLHEREVPPTILDDFQYRFQDAENVVWMKPAGEIYGARFKERAAKTEVVYASDGQWQQTVKEISYREMPDSARNYCRSNYPDYKADLVNKVSTRRYGIIYELLISHGTDRPALTFDMHGALIREDQSPPMVETPPVPEKQKGLKGKFKQLTRRKGNR